MIGAALVALTVVAPVLWILVAGYHLVLLVYVAGDLARLPARGFEVERRIPSPFSLGAEQQVEIEARNLSAAGLLGAVADHAPLQLGARPRAVEGRFDGSGRLRLEYTTRPPKRGAYDFERLDLRCWREGGWWMRELRVLLPARAAVYPDILAVRRYQLTLRRGLRMLPGQRRARPPGATTALAGLRDYLPGDDVRRINWKASARRDRPVTIEVEAERGQQVVIALDCGRLMTAAAGHLNKLDHAVNAALLLAWVAQSQGDRVGLLAFTDEVRRFLGPQRGAAQMHLINESLYAITPEYTEPDFGQAFGYLSRQVKGRSLVVVLSDVLDPEASADLVAHALRLSGRHLVLVVAMTDPGLLEQLTRPVADAARAFEWAAAEELMAARRRSFEILQRGGVQCLDVPAGRLSPLLVERYLELKERALI